MNVQCETEDGPVSQYLEKYRLFSECCSLLSRHLAAKDYDFKKIAEIQSEIEILQHTTSRFLSITLSLKFDFILLFLISADIYDGLQQLCGVLSKVEQPIRKSNEGINQSE